jgi:hypothetical protein
VANHYGYEAVFSRQVEALGVRGDMLVGISTSDNSPIVVVSLQSARSQGMKTVGLTGGGGGKIATLADHLFAVGLEVIREVATALPISILARCGPTNPVNPVTNALTGNTPFRLALFPICIRQYGGGYGGDPLQPSFPLGAQMLRLASSQASA